MIEPHEQRSFTERLIEQDADISAASLEERHMKLQQTLKDLEDHARASQRLTVRACVAVVICNLFGFVINVVGPQMPRVGEVLAVSWSICTITAWIVAGVAVTRYWTIHRPRLEQGRSDLQVALFFELQRQIEELKKQEN